jgi:hypothetical protein
LIPEIEKKMEEIKMIRTELRGKADIEREDPLLSVLANLNFTEELSIEEIEFIKLHYDELNSEYDKNKGNQKEFFKYTFPGSGDKKENPTGDLVIYHEMLKYMKVNQTDVIFLTNDTEKNDWLLRQQSELIPFTHYIISAFQNTERSLFILQARDKIRLTYSPIYTEEIDLTNDEGIQEVVDEDREYEQEDIKESELENEVTDVKKVKLKILGKIHIPEAKKVLLIDQRKGIEYEYNDITESEFLQELKASQDWADKYGNGFVGLRSFVVNYLGNKGYNYRRAYKTSEVLEEKGMIEKYTYHPDNSNYNDVLSIRIVDGQ